MIRTQIQLTERQAKELKRLAARRGVSIAEVIRDAVDQTIEAEHRPDDERWNRALTAIGCVHSGVGDLSERHDDYLVEAYSQ